MMETVLDHTKDLLSPMQPIDTDVNAKSPLTCAISG